MLIDPALQMIDGRENSDLSDQIRLANQVVNNGVTHALVAPQLVPETAGLPQYLDDQVARLQTELDQRGIPLVIFAGQVLPITKNTLQAVKMDNVLYADLNHRYLLMNWQKREADDLFRSCIFEVLKYDIRPVLVEPETCPYFLNDEDALPYYYDQGCHFMVSSDSLLGRRGPQTEQLVRAWFGQGYIQLVGSLNGPGHSQNYRFSQAFQVLDQWFGQEFGFAIRQNGKALINGDPLLTPSERPEKRRPFWFDLFRF